MKCPNCGYEAADTFPLCPNCHLEMASYQNTPIPDGGNVQNTAGVQDNQYLTNSSQVVGNTNNVANNNAMQQSAPQQGGMQISQVVPNEVVTSGVETAIESTNASLSGQEVDSLNNPNLVLPSDVSLKKDMSKVYYVIFAFCVVIFLGLMSIVIFKHLGVKNKEVVKNTSSVRTTEERTTILTKNKGVYSNLISPVNIGEVTFGGILDSNTNEVIDADVEITRRLNEFEIYSIVNSNNQTLNPGFKWDGVEYRVTLNDFDYLGNGSIIPKMKTYLFDTYYKNNFFLVNENYYTIETLNNFNIDPIRNGESTLLQVAYQVPIDQNYYICFGENFSSLGCFNNF